MVGVDDDYNVLPSTMHYQFFGNIIKKMHNEMHKESSSGCLLGTCTPRHC